MGRGMRYRIAHEILQNTMPKGRISVYCGTIRIANLKTRLPHSKALLTQKNADSPDQKSLEIFHVSV